MCVCGMRVSVSVFVWCGRRLSVCVCMCVVGG